MNSNYGKGSSGSLNSFNFDLGIGTTRNKSLNDQRNQTSTTSSFSSYSSAQPRPSWQPSTPSWAHQPVPAKTTQSGLSGPTSMVGDIFGRSWTSSAPSANSSNVGIVNKNPHLFGDLVGSALGQGKGNGNTNAPLKNATPAPNSSSKSPYSMGNMADSLPKTSDPFKSSGTWGSSGGYNSFGNSASGNVNGNKSANLGGPSMKSMGGSGAGGGIGTTRDPFGSLVDFGSKQSGGSLNSGSQSSKANVVDDAFGSFQNASKPSTTSFSSSGFTSSNNDFMSSNMSSGLNADNFGMPTKNVGSQDQPPIQQSGGDPLGMFFSSSSGSGGSTAPASTGTGGQQFSGIDDWGLDTDFGGAGGIDDGGSTTELEGLPPPPSGVTASAAKSKGIDNKNQGQYADAIKWLSWAVILLEKTSDRDGTAEALSCRASCYKEVGEYKKAVADCTKVLEHDEANVSVLVQRALLYESMEKYRLGAEDLRTVLKIDPGNRVARSTVHRLTKMAD